MSNNCLYGCYYGFRAIILHTFGVQVALKSYKPSIASIGLGEILLLLTVWISVVYDYPIVTSVGFIGSGFRVY